MRSGLHRDEAGWGWYMCKVEVYVEVGWGGVEVCLKLKLM